MTVVGGWCREQSAIRTLTKRGSTLGTPIRVGPTWLLGRLPEGAARFFDRVESVWLKGPATDADMAECGKLSQLRILILSGEQVTDAGVAELKQALPNVNVMR